MSIIAVGFDNKNKIENVGIRSDQKEVIKKIVDSNNSAYKSINEFVQAATEKLISETINKTYPDDIIETSITKTKNMINEIIRAELDDIISLSSNSISALTDLANVTMDIRLINYIDETAMLLYVRDFKNEFDNTIKTLSDELFGKLPTPYVGKRKKTDSKTMRLEQYINKLDNTKKEVIKLIYKKGEVK